MRVEMKGDERGEVRDEKRKKRGERREGRARRDRILSKFSKDDRVGGS
jgi:hypothetical protein